MDKNKIFYIISLIFITSGAFNIGVTRFWLAVPFMFFAITLSKKISPNKKVFYITAFFILATIPFNFTLEKNPLMFPILINNGYVEIQRDGYLEVFSDESGMFTESKEKVCSNCEQGIYKPLKKGDRYKVIGVGIGESRFNYGKKVVLLTEIGPFSEEDFSTFYGGENRPVSISKMYSPFRHFGVLMGWPLLILYPLSMSQIVSR